MKKILLPVLVIMTVLLVSAILPDSNVLVDQYPDDCLDTVKVPKRFTPNEDGENDYLEIKFPCPPEQFDFKLYDSFGEEVFASEKYIFQWAGYDNSGEPCPSGVYSWKLSYVFKLKVFDKQGQILILR